MSTSGEKNRLLTAALPCPIVDKISELIVDKKLIQARKTCLTTRHISLSTFPSRASVIHLFCWQYNIPYLDWRLNQIQRALSAVALMLAPQLVYAEDNNVEFNASFLSISGTQPAIDLSVFSKSNVALAGSYLVDIYVNKNFVEKSTIQFSDDNTDKQVKPCITREMLDNWGINLAAYPVAPAAVQTSVDDNGARVADTDTADQPAAIAETQCINIEVLIPAATVNYDAGQFRLELSIPQAAMRRIARGTVSAKLWNTGINAGLLDYQINLGRSDGDERTSVFAGLRAGVNIGAWRARQFSTFSPSRNGGGGWQTINAYGQRDVTSLQSQLIVGDASSSNDIFDGVQFRGVQMQTDEAMLPDSQRGYAPTIRGVAQTAAKVAVRQNGYTIYTTYVAPGPFVIDDLYSTSGSGDLEVTITEADGRETKFIQPFAALPVMMRDGAWRYSVAAGQYRSGYSARSAPVFAQATLTRGLPAGITLYGGANVSNIYGSAIIGTGINLHRFGAYSIDLAHARTQVTGRSEARGSSIRFRYAKFLIDSGTNFSILGYRYSTSSYRSFAEAARMQDATAGYPVYGQRSRMEGTVSQRIGADSTLYMTAGQQSYWGKRAKDNLVRLSYNSRLKKINYGVYLDYNTYDGGGSSKQISVSMSMPLGRDRGYVGYGAARNDQGNLTQTASYTATAFEDARLSYGVYADKRMDGSSGSGNITYLSPVARLDASRSQGRGYGQTSLSMTGGVVAHKGGVTLSQALGETIAVVNVPGARNVRIEGYSGIETDAAGNAVIPYISPYNKNRIELRTGDLGNDIEILNAVQDIVPRRGAVMLARFDTRIGHRVLFALTDVTGRSLPLGAKVEDDNGRALGIVGPDGQAYVTGLENDGSLTVKWGHETGQQCQVPYVIDDNAAATSAFKEITATCIITEEI